MSKSKHHAPQRRRNHKEKTRKSSSDRAKIQMTEETTNTLCATRTWLRTEESEKLRGRFNAFEDTLSKLHSTLARNRPPFVPRSIGKEDVHRHVDWVNEFKGVLVKRTFLDVGQKKGKAWADQHRALHLGKKFFVVLLDRLEQFIDKYHSYATDMSREKFLHECLTAVLKKTFSPGHKQAGETPLICDQAVKRGRTRKRLQRMLSHIKFDEQKIRKGRDIVELLEGNQDEDEDNDDTMHDQRRTPLETRSIASDQSNSVGTEDNDSPPSVQFDVVSPTSPRPSAVQQQSPPTPASATAIHVPQVLFPSTPSNWSRFPTSNDLLDREMLVRENQRLKFELDSLRRAMVAKEMGLIPTPYNFGTTTMALPIPNVEMYAHHPQQPDVPMLDVSAQFNNPFSLTPTASHFS